jgi:hypothetical protein
LTTNCLVVFNGPLNAAGYDQLFVALSAAGFPVDKTGNPAQKLFINLKRLDLHVMDFISFR